MKYNHLLSIVDQKRSNSLFIKGFRENTFGYLREEAL